MGTLVARTVNRLSARPSATSSVFASNGFSYDYAIGGLPFLSNASKETPLARKTAPYRKDQIDQTPIPGEQSMVFWWLRSQISFHGGSGIKFEEPALDPGILYSDPLSAQAIPVRYQDGEGIDPWTTPGQVTLQTRLLQSQQLAVGSPTGNILVLAANDPATNADAYLAAAGTTMIHATDLSSASITWGGASAILSLATDGTNYYAADNVGIYKGALPNGAGSLLWTYGSTSSVIIKWAKDRLVGCIGGSIYELVGAGGVLPAPTFTPNAPNWTWTAIEEGPDCIWFAGFQGATSKIYAVTLASDTGNVPILGVPVEIASLPTGEIVHSLKLCDGSILGIGTNQGVRLADVGTQGRIQYGPLQFESSTPVLALESYSHFLYCSGATMVDGTVGTYRVDLGFQTQFSRFASAKDYRTHYTGTITSMTFLGSSGRLVVGVGSALGNFDGRILNADTAFLAEPPGGELEPTGYLQTGNIRFHTQEPKLFKYFRLHDDLSAGSIAVSVTDESGSTTSIITLTDLTPNGDVAFPTSLGPQEWISVTFTLARDENTGNTGPKFFSYQIKALPGQKNQRNIIVPIKLFDREVDKYGNAIGGEGYAWKRLAALEAIEESRDNVLFQDLSRDGQDTTLVVVDDITFQQTDPPKNMSGFGGIAVVTLRTVT